MAPLLITLPLLTMCLFTHPTDEHISLVRIGGRVGIVEHTYANGDIVLRTELGCFHVPMGLYSSVEGT